MNLIYLIPNNSSVFPVFFWWNPSPYTWEMHEYANPSVNILPAAISLVTTQNEKEYQNIIISTSNKKDKVYKNVKLGLEGLLKWVNCQKHVCS